MDDKLDFDVYNCSLLSFLRNEIFKRDNETVRKKLTSFLACCTQVLPGPLNDFVYLVKHGEEVHYHGLKHCGNTFYCPHCTPRLMAQYRAQIAVALDELRRRGLKAFMMTVTIPHFHEMSALETGRILVKAWSQSMTGKTSRQDRPGYKNPMVKFRVECAIQHSVRVMEYTWGKNGWHPHFHIIYWVPGDMLQKVADYEQELRDYWNKRVQWEIIKYWKANKLHGFTEENTKIHSRTGEITLINNGDFKDEADVIKIPDIKTYSQITNYNRGKDNDLKGRHMALRRISRAMLSDNAKAIYISKVTDSIANTGDNAIIEGGAGKDTILEVTSANYVTGWGGDAELASPIKKAQKGHYTPLQMLEEAYETGNKNLIRRYIRFMLDMKEQQIHRVIWSKTGLRNIVLTVMKTEKYQELLKKKSKRYGELEIICWFTKDEWYKILYCRMEVNILYLAKHDRTLLFKYLEGLGIEYHTAVPGFHLQILQATYQHLAA